MSSLKAVVYMVREDLLNRQDKSNSGATSLCGSKLQSGSAKSAQSLVAVWCWQQVKYLYPHSKLFSLASDCMCQSMAHYLSDSGTALTAPSILPQEVDDAILNYATGAVPGSRGNGILDGLQASDASDQVAQYQRLEI